LNETKDGQITETYLQEVRMTNQGTSVLEGKKKLSFKVGFFVEPFMYWRLKETDFKVSVEITRIDVCYKIILLAMVYINMFLKI
jgi:hypothetical protein